MKSIVKGIVLLMLVWPLAGFHADTAQFNVECGDDALVKGHPEQALKYWAHAVELDARYTPAYLSRGFYYLKNGRTSLAVDDFTRVIEINPQDPAPYLTRGLALSQSGARERAMADFRTGCRLGDQSACSFLDDATARKNP